MDQNVQMGPSKEKVHAASFAAKFASKKECFNFLSVEVGVYLCHHEALTIYFLRDLIYGRKRCKKVLSFS